MAVFSLKVIWKPAKIMWEKVNSPLAGSLIALTVVLTAISMLMIMAALSMGRAWTPPVFVTAIDQSKGTSIIEAGTDPNLLLTLSFGSLEWHWSSSGRQVALIPQWGDAEQYRDIYVVDLDRGNLTNISQHPGSDTAPVWSPDGSRIAFVSWRDKNAEIYITTPAGEEMTNISQHPGSDTAPVWSPDSRMLAFISDRDGNDDIYMVNADGSNLKNLSRQPAHDTLPVWSPAGDMIAFVSTADEQSEVMMVDVRTHTLFRLSGIFGRILSLSWFQYE